MFSTKTPRAKDDVIDGNDELTMKIKTGKILDMVNMTEIRSDEDAAGATNDGVYSRDKLMHNGMNDHWYYWL